MPAVETFKPLLSHNEVAKRLGVPNEVLRRMAMRGDVPSFKVGSRRIYRLSDLDSWISSEKRPTKWWTQWIERLRRFLSHS
jgi:excisionase family DNA binding protein